MISGLKGEEDNGLSLPALWEHRGKMAARKPGRGPFTGTDDAGAAAVRLQTPDCKKINFCCLNHPICGILLRQSDQTKTENTFIPDTYLHSEDRTILYHFIWFPLRLECFCSRDADRPSRRFSEDSVQAALAHHPALICQTP